LYETAPAPNQFYWLMRKPMQDCISNLLIEDISTLTYIFVSRIAFITSLRHPSTNSLLFG